MLFLNVIYIWKKRIFKKLKLKFIFAWIKRKKKRSLLMSGHPSSSLISVSLKYSKPFDSIVAKRLGKEKKKANQFNKK